MPNYLMRVMQSILHMVSLRFRNFITRRALSTAAAAGHRTWTMLKWKLGCLRRSGVRMSMVMRRLKMGERLRFPIKGVWGMSFVLRRLKLGRRLTFVITKIAPVSTTAAGHRTWTMLKWKLGCLRRSGVRMSFVLRRLKLGRRLTFVITKTALSTTASGHRTWMMLKWKLGCLRRSGVRLRLRFGLVITLSMVLRILKMGLRSLIEGVWVMSFVLRRLMLGRRLVFVIKGMLVMSLVLRLKRGYLSLVLVSRIGSWIQRWVGMRPDSTGSLIIRGLSIIGPIFLMISRRSDE